MTESSVLERMILDQQKQLTDYAMSLGEAHGRLRAQEQSQTAHGSSIRELTTMVDRLRKDFDAFELKVMISWKWALGVAVGASSIVGPLVTEALHYFATRLGPPH